MKLKYIYLVFLINYIKSAYYNNKRNINPLINEGFRVYDTFHIDDSRALFYNGSYLQIIYPERNFSDFYLIFDYYIHKNTSEDDFNITIFDKTYYEIRSKIILKINTTKEFSIYLILMKAIIIIAYILII